MNDVDLHILIEPDGSVRFIYSDDLAAVFAGEPMATRRMSHVEPARAYGIDSDGWVADLSPCGGPLLTGPNYEGFDTRDGALKAETDWLRKEFNL